MGKGKGQARSTDEEIVRDDFYNEAKLHIKTAGGMVKLATIQIARGLGMALYGWSVRRVSGLQLATIATDAPTDNEGKGMN
jgi:hypothetical protein